jgi:hypothetical protein
MAQPKDRNGRPVEVGSRVRVMELPRSFVEMLPDDEVEDVCSMVGAVFEVRKIDEYGRPWVERWWNPAEAESYCHSLALDTCEMELVEDRSANRA